MSVIRPTRSSSERKQEKRAVAVIRGGSFFMREKETVEEPQEEIPTDPYDPVDWKTGDVITAERLNQTDDGVDKNADAIKVLKAQQPSSIPTSFIDNLF